jgi:hypothetical protein
MTIMDCLALSREAEGSDLDDAAILARLQRHYEGVNFDDALAAAYRGLAERDAFARARR